MEIKVFRRDWSEKLKKRTEQRKEEDDMSKEFEALRKLRDLVENLTRIDYVRAKDAGVKENL